MKKGLKLACQNLGLLVFILAFITVFNTAFGATSLYVGVFILTGLLMYKEMPLGISQASQWVIIPGLYVLATIVPYWLMLSLPLFLKIMLVVGTVICILGLLVRTIAFQSYIPFLLLFALNQQNQTPIGPRLIAAVIGGVVVVAVAWLYRKKRQQNWTAPMANGTFKENVYQNRAVIIKLTLGILCAYLVGQWLAVVKVGWIMVTVISLTQPDLKVTRQKAGQRLGATVIGLLIFSIVFLVIVPQNYFTLLIVGISYAYMFVKSYFIRMIFNTVNALNAAVFTLSLTPNVMLVERLVFVLLGVVVVYLIGYAYRYFERNRVSQSA